MGRARRPRFVIDIFYRVDTIKLSIKAGFVHREQTSLSSRYFQKLRYLLLFRTAYINRTSQAVITLFIRPCPYVCRKSVSGTCTSKFNAKPGTREDQTDTTAVCIGPTSYAGGASSSTFSCPDTRRSYYTSVRSSRSFGTPGAGGGKWGLLVGKWIVLI